MGYDTPDPMGYFYDPRLLSMQQSDGSFGYWPGATETNEWVTPYAGMALTLASQNGGSVPPSALEILS